jgi:predicted thioesterase
MIAKFNIGDTKTFIRQVRKEDFAEFEAGQVHPFYATFALGRDAEWAGRLFVLEMLEEDEEGIGTSLTIDHHSPALEGQEVVITSTITSLEGTQLDCSFEARVGDRLIASGTTGQRILKKSVVQRIEDKAKD